MKKRSHIIIALVFVMLTLSFSSCGKMTVPDNLEDRVITITESPLCVNLSYTSSNLCGLIWLVFGKTFSVVSFSKKCFLKYSDFAKIIGPKCIFITLLQNLCSFFASAFLWIMCINLCISHFSRVFGYLIVENIFANFSCIFHILCKLHKICANCYFHKKCVR